MSPIVNHVPFLLVAAVSSFILPDRVQAQSSEAEVQISDEELALRQDISDSLVGTWLGTFRARNPQTDEISDFDYRLDHSWTRTDGFLVGEGGLVRDGGVQRWSHDVYSWDADTGQLYISFNGFGVPITHEYTVEGLDVGEDTPDRWSFVRTHTGRVGNLGIIQQRVTVQKDGDRYHAVTENRDPDTDEDFEFAYEMILERASASARMSPDASAPRTIPDFADAFVSAVRDWDVDAWAELVSDDVVMMAPNGRIVEGRDAFRDMWKRTFEGRTGRNPLEVVVRDVSTEGDLAVVRTDYGPEGREPVGQYVWALERDERGAWMLAWWIFNRRSETSS